MQVGASLRTTGITFDTAILVSGIGTLKNLVRKIDPDAFVTINNVHEVLGEGFRIRI